MAEHSRVSVAVVQLAYHPAAVLERRNAIEDPLFQFKSRGGALSRDFPPAVGARLNDLRQRIKEAYLSQLEKRLKAILEHCAAWGVHLVVFPEYSIPWQLLGALSSAAKDIVVVAGTHTVDQAALRAKLYSTLGDAEPRLGEAVCPILYNGRIIGLQPKLNPASPEEPGMVRGSAWAPIPLPAPLSSGLGVLVCLDYLFRQSDAHVKLVLPVLPQCRLLAVPSLTPHYTRSGFDGHGWEDARHYRQPVLYSNIAGEGGTTLYIDEGAPTDLERFPEHVGRFGRGEEGVIVAEVDLGWERVGESRTYDWQRPVRPIACASFVYRAQTSEQRYAQHIDALSPHLGQADVLTATGELESRQRELLEMAPSWPAARRRRIASLYSDLQGVTSMEQLKQSLREVLLPGDVLPLDGLRSALACGASDTLSQWIGEGLGGDGLLSAWDELRTSGNFAREPLPADWTDEGRRALSEVVQRVGGRVASGGGTGSGGGGPGGEPGTSRLIDVDWRSIVVSRFQSQCEAALSTFSAERYDDARKEFSALRTATKELLDQSPGDADISRQAARFGLLEGMCLLCLQELDAAIELFDGIDVEALDADDHARLAEAWARLGELEKARTFLARAQGSTRHARVKRIIEIQEGLLPNTLPVEPEFQLEAAPILLARGKLAEAVRWVESSLAKLSARALHSANAVQSLFVALRDSVWEPRPEIDPVPLEHREAVVNETERLFSDLLSPNRLPPLPLSVRQSTEQLLLAFQMLSQDHEAAAQTQKRLAESGSPALPELDEIGRLIDAGQTEAALAELVSEPHPWRARWRRVGVLLLADRNDEALAEALALATEFPGRAPVEFQVAKMLLEQDRSAEAVAHAQAAFRALPGRGYRLLLTQSLFKAGRTSEAWSIIQSVANDRELSPGFLAWAALSALGANVPEAESLVQRYLAVRPNDATMKVNLALYRLQHGDAKKAAEEAWSAINAEGSDQLEPELLLRVALHQQHADLPTPELRERLLHIELLLRERYGDRPGVESYRLQILAELGFPNGVPQLDLEGLVARGDVRMASIDDVRAMLEGAKQREHAVNMMFAWYRAGKISYETLCDLTQTAAAVWFDRIVKGEAKDLRFATPVSTADAPEPQPVAGYDWLMGELEILLLQHLELHDRFRSALASSGRILLFKRVLDRIRQYPTSLPTGSDEQSRSIRQRTLRIVEWVQRGIDEGWIASIDDVDVPGLPALSGEGSQADATQAPEDLRRPFANAFAFREALVDHPQRRLLTADFAIGCLFTMGAPRDVVQLFRWQAPTDAVRLRERLVGVAEQVSSIPEVVLSLRQASVVRDEDLLRLARIGFQDALSSHQLAALARRQGGLGSGEAQAVLSVVESVASLEDHAATPAPCMRLGLVYGTSIWISWHPPTLSPYPTLDAAERDALTSALLDRAEARDVASPTQYGLLDEVLRVIFRYALLLPRTSFVPAGEEFVRLDTSSESIWTSIINWAGKERRRRMAFARIFAEALVDLDKRSGENGPDFHRVAPMILAFLAGLPKRPGDLVLSPEGEALAVLSACWKQRPLSGQKLEIRRSNQAEPIKADLESILKETAEKLEKDRQPLEGNEAVWIVPGALGELPVSPEAILLRLAPESELTAGLARGLADHQGLHDGRSYGRLYEFAASPGDAGLRRQVARNALRAPWRLFRADPIVFRRWGHDPNLFPRTIEDLRELLSEPPGPLPTEGGFLPARMAENGPWHPDRRSDFAELARQAAEVPGTFVVAPTKWRLDKAVFPYEVEAALSRLKNAQEQPSARTEGDILFLVAAAMTAPEVQLSSEKVNLRTELMPRLSALLGQASTDSPPDSLSASEAALLRIRSQTIEVLSNNSRRGELTIRDGLWLSFRLYQWLSTQIESIDVSSRRNVVAALSATAPSLVPVGQGVRAVLNPPRFAHDRFDHRLASVLFALATIENYLRGIVGIDAANPSGSLLEWSTLDERLIELAARPLTEEERSLRDPVGGVADFGWQGAPSTVPDLALQAILQHDSTAFVRFDEATRLRWLSELAAELPPSPGARSELIQRLLVAAAGSASAITDAEKKSLRAIADQPNLRSPLRALILISLYGAGDVALSGEAARLVSDHLADPTGSELVGRYAYALSIVNPERFDDELDRVLAQVEAAGGPAVVFVTSLGKFAEALQLQPFRVAVGGLLTRLAERPPYRANQELDRIASVLNAPGEPTEAGPDTKETKPPA